MIQKKIVEGDLELYGHYHNIFANAILGNPGWQEETDKHSKNQFNTWMLLAER